MLKKKCMGRSLNGRYFTDTEFSIFHRRYVWGIHTWGRGDDKFFNPRGKTNHHPREAKPRGDDGFFPPRVEKLIIPETPGVSAIHLILIA